MNSLYFTGRFTRDPELKESNGTKYTFFSLAQDVPVKDGNKKVIYIPFTAFGQTAESICKFFKKGQPILVEARMSSSDTEGEAKDTKITRVSQIVNRWEFMSSKADGDKSASNAAPAKASSAPTHPAESDELPF